MWLFGGSRWFWHQRFKFSDGSPTSPVPHTCLVSKRPDLVWCRVRTYRIFHPTYKQSWNQVKYHIHCHPGVTVLQYFNPIYMLHQCLSAIGDLPLGVLVLWMLWYAEYNVHATDVPNAMAWISNFYINDCWAGSWLRVWVNSWANIFSHRWLLMPWHW